MHERELRAIAFDRFGNDSEPLIRQVIAAGANFDGVAMATKEASDFDAWRADMEDWIEWLGETQ